MSQSQLPIYPADYTLINPLFGFKKQDGVVYYFNGSLPIYQHSEDDELSFRFITSQMVVTSGVKQMDIVRAFGVTKISVQRGVKRLREDGIDGLRKTYAGGSAHVMTSGVCKQAQKLLDKGQSPAEIGRTLGINADTIRKAIKRGDLHRPKKKDAKAQPESASTKSERTVADQQAVMGLGCTREAERAAAAQGRLDGPSPFLSPMWMFNPPGL